MTREQCNPPRTPYVTGRPIEGGALATRKQDFNSHNSGMGFRHCADHIDMNPPLDATPEALNVQETLEQLSLTALKGIVVSIGNENKAGDYTVGDVDIPDLNTAITAALANPQLTSGYGGIIFIKAGLYTVTSKITLPAGISIWGEYGGTVINAEFSSGLSATDRCLFSINGAVAPYLFSSAAGWGANMFTSQSRVFNEFRNIICYDNLFKKTLDPVESFIYASGDAAVRVVDSQLVGYAGGFGHITNNCISLGGVDNNSYPTILEMFNSYCVSTIPVEFLPINNVNKHNVLKIENCTLLSTSNLNIVSNGLDINISNNIIYMLSDATIPTSSTSPANYIGIKIVGNEPMSGTKVIITGNSGGLIDFAYRFQTAGQGRFFKNDSGYVFQLTLRNNNWGNNSWAESVNYGNNL